jgi:hypothetical protein
MGLLNAAYPDLNFQPLKSGVVARMDRKSDEEISLFVRNEQTGRFLFNDRALQALGLDPAQLQQRGYPVSVNEGAGTATERNQAA